MSQMYLITTVNAFSGLSTDEKQTLNVKVGSTYHERDTGKSFRFIEGAWCEDNSIGLPMGGYLVGISELKTTLETLTEMSTTLKKIEQHLSLASDVEIKDQDVGG